MSRLASWVVVVVAGLFAGSVCCAENGELIPIREGYTESSDENRVIQAIPPSPGVPITPIVVTSGELELAPVPVSGPATPGSVIMGGGRMTSRKMRSGDYIGDYPLYVHSTLLHDANAQRAALIQSLQALQDAYCRNAQLDEAIAVRDMIRQLQAQAKHAITLPEPVVTPLPGVVESPYAYDLRGQNDKTFYRHVTGSVDGYVWGGENNIYTDDSILATAAVHAGVLKAGETAMLRFTILAGKDSYVGSTKNGVTTRPYQSFGGSVRIDGAAPELDSVYNLRGQDKPPFAVYVVGNLGGSVYGTGSYTDDSSIATAAVHAGLLKEGEAGFVMVTLEGGKDSYEASTQNGVTTYSYGSWSGGFRLSKYETVKTSMRLGSHHFTLDVF